MQGLEKSIGEMADALMAMPREELRRLEKATEQLTPEQTDFVRFTLESSLLDERLPTHRLALLEYFFESWWQHSLATKLVVIDRIIDLSHGGVWPGDIPLRDAASDACGDACAVAAS